MDLAAKARRGRIQAVFDREATLADGIQRPLNAGGLSPRAAKLQPSAQLRVAVTDGHGRRRSAGALPTWLARVAPRAAAGVVALALVGDRKMRDLNSRFRAIDQVTDVLAFPADPTPAATRPGADRFLGDIVIATGRAARQARAAGVTEQQEWRRLALHGLLHLLGHDHERDGGQMRRLERRLQRRGGLPGTEY